MHVPSLRPSPVVLPDDGRPSGVVLVRGDEETGVVRMLFYRPDADALPPGRYVLAGIPAGQTREPLSVQYVTAVDADRRRVAVAVEQEVATSADEMPARGGAFDVGAVFPNPYRPGSGKALRIPVRLSHPARVEATVYDATGRVMARFGQDAASGANALAWDGRLSDGTHLRAGLYAVRVRTQAGAEARTFLVVP